MKHPTCIVKKIDAKMMLMESGNENVVVGLGEIAKKYNIEGDKLNKAKCSVDKKKLNNERLNNYIEIENDIDKKSLTIESYPKVSGHDEITIKEMCSEEFDCSLEDKLEKELVKMLIKVRY
ncbi:hypothetical protein F8M41_014868 [Gigaspora margarita]|uniref:Uncharacterized protein n=1 Tax=Gigaspora margarita TaxID=4874 RepID=A0A8H4ENL6_GIGMA|nr:hypothetical protein F8M41_014868 [Gigaspora margarita]